MRAAPFTIALAVLVPAIAYADEPAPANGRGAGTNGHVFLRLIEALDTNTAPDLRPQGMGTRGQDGFEMLHRDCDAGVGRARQAIEPPGSIDIVIKELDASEMPAGTAGLLHPMRAGLGTTARTVFRGLRGRDLLQQTATIESFDAGHRQAPQAEGKLFQRGPCVLVLLQHQHGQVGKAQFTGKEQSDRPRAGNHDIIQQGTDPPSHRYTPACQAALPRSKASP